MLLFLIYALHLQNKQCGPPLGVVPNTTHIPSFITVAHKELRIFAIFVIS